MVTLVDERGRILIPKALRDRFGMHPGTPVIIEEDEEGIHVHAQDDAVEAFRRLMATVARSKPDPDAPYLDPLEVKRIWEPKF